MTLTDILLQWAAILSVSGSVIIAIRAVLNQRETRRSIGQLASEELERVSDQLHALHSMEDDFSPVLDIKRPLENMFPDLLAEDLEWLHQYGAWPDNPVFVRKSAASVVPTKYPEYYDPEKFASRDRKLVELDMEIDALTKMLNRDNQSGISLDYRAKVSKNQSDPDQLPFQEESQ